MAIAFGGACSPCRSTKCLAGCLAACLASLPVEDRLVLCGVNAGVCDDRYLWCCVVRRAGLFLADEPAMNQLAFFFVTSVLVDTFITRTILVPCIMDVLGGANWLPRPMPTPRLGITQEGDEVELPPPVKDTIQ